MPKKKESGTLAMITALVGIGAGAGLIGGGDSLMHMLFDETTPSAAQSLENTHCTMIYDSWTQLELAGKEQAASALLEEVMECNSTNSGSDTIVEGYYP